MSRRLYLRESNPAYRKPLIASGVLKSVGRYKHEHTARARGRRDHLHVAYVPSLSASTKSALGVRTRRSR